MTDTTTETACRETPWYDETGCDVHDDGLHRCGLFDSGHRVHPCDCGALVIEDRAAW